MNQKEVSPDYPIGCMNEVMRLGLVFIVIFLIYLAHTAGYIGQPVATQPSGAVITATAETTNPNVIGTTTNVTGAPHQEATTQPNFPAPSPLPTPPTTPNSTNFVPQGCEQKGFWNASSNPNNPRLFPSDCAKVVLKGTETVFVYSGRNEIGDITFAPASFCFSNCLDIPIPNSSHPDPGLEVYAIVNYLAVEDGNEVWYVWVRYLCPASEVGNCQMWLRQDELDLDGVTLSLLPDNLFQ